MCILGHWALLLNTGKPVDSGDEGLRLVSLHKNACNIHLPEAYGVVGNHGCMYIYIYIYNMYIPGSQPVVQSASF